MMTGNLGSQFQSFNPWSFGPFVWGLWHHSASWQRAVQRWPVRLMVAGKGKKETGRIQGSSVSFMDMPPKNKLPSTRPHLPKIPGASQSWGPSLQHMGQWERVKIQSTAAVLRTAVKNKQYENCKKWCQSLSI